jgi:iron complex transport system substrate-binding protein
MSSLVLALLVVAAPSRVVSMAPGLTDLVVALGERPRLVGVSRFDDDPALAALPRVGGLLDPSIEAVIRLHPDLVLALDGAAFEPTIRAMKGAGLNVLALRSDSLDDVRAGAEQLGTALGVPEAGVALWTRLQGELDRARRQSAGRPPVRVAIAVGYRPLMLAGRGSYLEPLIEVVGGVNAASSNLAWPTSGFESLVQTPPDVLIDAAPNELDDSARRMLDILRGRGTRVVRLSDGELFRPGPRAIAAVPELAGALRPGDATSRGRTDDGGAR